MNEELVEILDEIHQFINNPKNQPDDEYKLLTKEEYDILIESFIESQGVDNVTLDQTMKVIRWAEQAMVDYSFLQLVLKGLISVGMNENWELTFVNVDK